MIPQNYITDLYRANPLTEQQLHETKRMLAKKYRVRLVENSTLIEGLRTFKKTHPNKDPEKLLQLLRRRKIRTLSGVAPITVLTKPFPCPGRCIYCPTEARMPKSYLSSEPAAQRAVDNAFDPYKQVKSRIQQLEANGHVADKIELIVLGGTWSFYPKRYQTWFIKRCFDAANERRSASIEKAHQTNERARHRIIGVTLETRPDYVDAKELWHMRKLGCTHVQIGVQSLDQGVLDLNKRDDSIENIARATGLLKAFGFKFTYHIMPGLPGSTPKKDIETVRTLFSDERFQPDMLKIYPTVVVKTSLLYQWWKKGLYKPYSDKILRDTLVAIKRIIPPYVRINRLIRDIPGTDIIDGNLVTNLRQKLQEQGATCQCIRCREARGQTVKENQVELVIRSYRSSEGLEFFISFENKDRSTIYAFVRLYLPPRHKGALGDHVAFIRELHTYGELIPVGSKKKAVQHIGFGKRLMVEAEKIAQQNDFHSLAVISGIGVREYYRKLGFALKSTYLVKTIS